MKEVKRKSFLLIGFMGSGKSSLLQRLSKLEGDDLSQYSCFDLDAELEKDLSMPISSWVDENSWEKFREKEEEKINNLSERSSPCIISCGGGSVHLNNITLLKELFYIVYLNTEFEECWQRIKDCEKRPLVKMGKKYCSDLYEKREPVYKQAHEEIGKENPLFDLLVIISKVVS